MDYMNDFVIKENNDFYVPKTVKGIDVPLHKYIHFIYEGRSYSGSTDSLENDRIKIKLHYSFYLDYSDFCFYSKEGEKRYLTKAVK